jgi:hypothetical protein
MKENFLHKKLPDLHKSPEVKDAVDKHTRIKGETVPNTAEDKLGVYMGRLEKIFLNEDEGTRKRNIEMLREKMYSAFIIKREDVPESFFELQKRIARERGQTVEDISPEMREKMIDVIIEDQKKSLDEWVNYLTSSDAMYPTWFKYFVFRNIVKLSQFDKELGKFKERTKATTSPFPDIYYEALAQMADLYESAAKDKALFNDKDFQVFLSKKFGVQYADAIQKTLEHGEKDSKQVKGKWVKYSKGNNDDAKKLYESLQGKGTGWCTAGHSTAQNQIDSGDFYVYYTYDKDGAPSNPRLAIRMEDDRIGEVRGVLPHQGVEPLLQETLDTKLSEFGGEADTYKKKSSDMRQLTLIEKAIQEGKPLTRNDLLFLYEIHGKIEGFGYRKDPRIKELLSKRNRTEDIQTICNCPPEHIAGSFRELTASTEVFCEDNGERISIIDFREERYKGKLEKLLELKKKLKEIGSPATPDMSFEGGFIGLEITKNLADTLSTWNGIQKAYQDADYGSPSYVWDELDGIPYTPLHVANRDILVLNHKRTTPQERDTLVENMNKIGYRPLTFLELVALGITKPEYNKRNEILNTYKKFSLVGELRVPYLDWDGDKR